MAARFVRLLLSFGIAVADPGFGLFASGTGTVPQEKRPNVILIMADDLGWKDLHCYGNETLDTPAIDGLASQGMLFTDAYSAAPVCTPTRAAIMTGQSPARLRITNHAPGHPPGFALPNTKLKSADWTRHLARNHVTIAERLQDAGYATAFAGKWHLSFRPRGAARPEEVSLRPDSQGFDRNFGGCHFGGPPAYFAPFKNPALLEGDEPYLPDRLADECIKFIREKRDQPFFVCLWNYSVHYPFEAPADLIAKYEHRKTTDSMDIRNPTYAAMIEGMDRSIGRLLTTLDELGLTDDTLVIFTSDNGPFAADVRPLRMEKGHLYEGGIRVPLIIRWPGVVQPETQCAIPVISMDLYSTIAAACELPQSSGTLDGEDLRPLLSRSGTLKRKAIFFHYPNYAFHKKNRLASAIREGDFKLLRFYDDDSLELYDLSLDPGEQNNLVNERPDLARTLQQKLDAWLLESEANLPEKVN